MRLPELILARKVALAAAVLLAALPAAAQTMRVLQAAPLRTERGGEAALAQLGAGQSVTLLQMSGGWVRVQSAGVQGWLRASQVELPSAEVADASLRESGRRAPGANAVTLGVRSLQLRNGRHALIVGLGSYREDTARPVQALAGVAQDMANAMAMALRMKVPSDQMTVLRDAFATRDGLRTALQDLATQLQDGDRVFVYWSGQGSRLMDKSAGSCVDALVPYDLQDIAPRELGDWLQPLLAKAGKVLFVVDAGPAQGGCRPAAANNAAPAAPNLVQVSAARPEEGGPGSVTAALHQCLLDSAERSIAELTHCAQTRVDAAARSGPERTAPRVRISGPGDYVPL